ncbi:MAG TPA: hypothetical protein VF221_18595 [Chloroflexota bacterium]
MPWAAAILMVLATGLIAWSALATRTPTNTTTVRIVPGITASPLLDRNAERQQQAQTSRSGGPGGQIGDAP